VKEEAATEERECSPRDSINIDSPEDKDLLCCCGLCSVKMGALEPLGERRSTESAALYFCMARSSIRVSANGLTRKSRLSYSVHVRGHCTRSTGG